MHIWDRLGFSCLGFMIPTIRQPLFESVHEWMGAEEKKKNLSLVILGSFSGSQRHHAWDIEKSPFSFSWERFIPTKDSQRFAKVSFFLLPDAKVWTVSSLSTLCFAE